MVMSRSLFMLGIYLIQTKSSVEGVRSEKIGHGLRLSYGEPCSTSFDLREGQFYNSERSRIVGGGDCDPDAFLRCNGGRCVCESEGDMLFNQTLGKCLVRANRQCNTNPNCVPHATCTTNTTNGSAGSQGLTEEGGGDVRQLPGWESCNCNPGYRSYDLMGLCLLWYNEPCSSANDECHYGVHLKCLTSNDGSEICGCNPDRYVWSADKNTCQGLDRTPCYPPLGDECIESAVCSEEFQECRCSPEFSATPTKSCLLRRGSQCDNPTQNCNHYNNLVCNNSRCECPLGNQLMFYEQDTDKCYMRLGQSCSKIFGMPMEMPQDEGTAYGGIITELTEPRVNILSHERDEDKASYGCHPTAECSPQSICECTEGDHTATARATKDDGSSHVAICDPNPSSSSSLGLSSTKDLLKVKIGISYLGLLLLTFFKTQAWQINY